jgi:hypothetical protein
MCRHEPSSTQTLHDPFADLTRDATELEDIQLLVDILNYMLRNPWKTNIDRAWVHLLLGGKGTRDIDLERALAVINLLREKNSYAATVPLSCVRRQALHLWARLRTLLLANC